MQLNDEQKRTVAAWIAEGAKLSEVQQRLGEEFGIRLTYMEARFLVDDLKLVPQEKVEPVPTAAEASPANAAAEAVPPTPAEPAPAGAVRVQLDQIVRPGALVSGTVIFSDGMAAEWQLDQMGRFGLVPSVQGYRPSKEDLAEFRVVLEETLARQGL
jgi:hypothetical protein